MAAKKILLINATTKNARCTFNEPLSLGILAALTPPTYEIEFIDENFEEFTFRNADLVAVTATTFSANRAYKIAEMYRVKNIPTIIGGFHATLLPDEASNYFDCVVVGEAENSWPRVLSDFENNQLQKIYDCSGDPGVPKFFAKPRRDIYNKYPYPCHTIETSRGCPFKCSFCSVSTFFNNKCFERPIDDIIEELTQLKDKLIFFSDDNFIGSLNNKQRLIEILYKIISLKLKIDWICFCSIDIYNHDDILKLLRKSGCKMILVGFESSDIESVREINKLQNAALYKKENLVSILKKIHSYGLAVMGGFIFGFDHDNMAGIENRINGIKKSGIDWFSATLLTPLPGTALISKLKSEHRLMLTNYPGDWEKYNFLQMVFEPKNIDKAALENFIKTNQYLFNCRNAIRRFFRTIIATRSLKSACYTHIWVVYNWTFLRKCFLLNGLIKFFYWIKYLK